MEVIKVSTNEKYFPKNISQYNFSYQLWVVCNITENNRHLQLFIVFIQSQKRDPTSRDEINILT